MHHSSLRRSLVLAAIAAPIANFFQPLFANETPARLVAIQEKLAELETMARGRIGVSAVNTANDVWIHYRAEERFPVTSTFKVIAVAAILKLSVKDANLLQQIIKYAESDLVSWSPVTEKNVSEGMSIAALCAATIQYSDNTAANLLMKVLGGPEAVTQFARSIGDDTFRLDRWETELNSAIPEDLRDTTTPKAMARSLRQLVLGDVLPEEQRAQLQNWLKGNTTGDASIRASVPKDWIVADKTGGGAYGTTNDIAVLWPPKGAPIVVAIYFTHNTQDAPSRKDVIAAATALLIKEWA